MTNETREQRQQALDSRVSELRAQASRLESEASRIRGSVNDDPAFWTQPAYNNSAGRAFNRQRERESAKILKSCEIHDEARKLREKADGMEARGVVMAGDAAAERQSKIAAVKVEVGQMVDTTFYGVRKVLKVNAKTVIVEASGRSNLKVDKNFLRFV